ncbi:MAG: hypothetical protein [Caudoviricetes sp.]|nr:MAG: hypothetical protein [Caudoviricetes sp.]
MNFPSLGLIGRGLTGDDLMRVNPEQTHADFAYGDLLEVAASGLNVTKGDKLLLLAIDTNSDTDFPLMVEHEDGRQFWITTWNVNLTGENVADQLPPQEQPSDEGQQDVELPE